MKIVTGDPTKGIAPRGVKPGRAKLRKVRLRTQDGLPANGYVIDVDSDTLTNDMLTLFRLNVARARKETRARLKTLSVAAE